MSLPNALDASPLFDLGLIGVHALGPHEQLDPRLRDALAGAPTHMLDVVLVPW